ncbi:MAG: restriction endonuclease [Chloroflexi bacterium]|nr:restriction endonuclease [Chloroflexota bacterium]MYF80279.1 restriction endonuclease [Chloroflexota bacterium]MYI03897.1 restriction endonuclease [Chloroflexota bacterium]
MRSVLVDVLVALLILMIGGAILSRLAGVEEGETAPAWVQFGPLVLAMLFLGWRTMRRGRQRREAEQRAAEEEEAMGGRVEFEGEVTDAPVMSEFEWRSRVDSMIRNLGSDAFQRFTLQFLTAIGLSEIEVKRTAFDGAVECVATSGGNEDGDGVGVYVIFRRSFGSLGANQIRDLHERMDEEDYEGLYITNGDFSASARSEAESSEDGTRLIDGDELIDLMQRQGLGLILDELGRVTAVDEAWFRALESSYLTREDD